MRGIAIMLLNSKPFILNLRKAGPVHKLSCSKVYYACNCLEEVAADWGSTGGMCLLGGPDTSAAAAGSSCPAGHGQAPACVFCSNGVCYGYWQEAVGARAAQALVRLLVGPDAGAAAAGATALRNVAEHPRARQALAAVLAGVPAAQKVAPQAPCAARPACRGSCHGFAR